MDQHRVSLVAQLEKNPPAMQEIPGSGRSAGEGIGYSLHCSWASLVAQLVKNPGDLGLIPGFDPLIIIKY